MKKWTLLISLFLSSVFLSNIAFASKPIMLAFRPDLTDVPSNFTHAIVPIYTSTNFDDIKNLLNNQLKNYVKVAAIDDMNQNNRINLVKSATSAGFNMIELDEQLSHLTSSEWPQFARDLDNLKTYTALPIAITSVPAPLYDFVNDTYKGKPDIIFMEIYDQIHYDPRLVVPIKNRLAARGLSVPVYGVVNIADAGFKTASDQTFLREVTRYLFYNGDGIWFWGRNTGNPTFDSTSNTNWPIVKGLIAEFYKSPPRSGGCPILNAWNGEEFKEIELLNIHAPKDQDTTYTSTFSMQPKGGKYEIILREAAYWFWDGSHINSVKLVDSNGEECQLISAVHSKQGDVLQDLLYSDDRRVRIFPGNEIKLVYDSCFGNDFSFTIEGYNMKCAACGMYVFGYPLILIAPIISFVFVLLTVALYLLILNLLEKYKII